MADVTMCQCDGCGLRVTNRNEYPGWLHFGGAVTRSVGRYRQSPGCWASAYVRGESDFCSITCLVTKLDSLGKVDRKALVAAQRQSKEGVK